MPSKKILPKVKHESAYVALPHQLAVQVDLGRDSFRVAVAAATVATCAAATPSGNLAGALSAGMDLVEHASAAEYEAACKRASMRAARATPPDPRLAVRACEGHERR